jgi:hypothetical protein
MVVGEISRLKYSLNLPAKVFECSLFKSYEKGVFPLGLKGEFQNPMTIGGNAYKRMVFLLTKRILLLLITGRFKGDYFGLQLIKL